MRNGFWMHKHAMDVFIEVVRLQYRDMKRTRLKIRWWNLGYVGNPYCISSKIETVTIKTTDLANWHQLTNRQLNTPRLAPGLPG